ncbi:MAG: division/cell wall cluster transcriptional repressor MraZ [Pirellulaceae bacterium]
MGNALLTGTFVRSLDEKQRFSIPKRLRDLLGHPEMNLVYITPGTDRSLALYTEESLRQMGDQLSAGSPIGQDVRTFSRLFYAQATCLEIDRQGRVRIPPELMQLASLGTEVVLLGVRDHLEIWDRRSWQSYLDDKLPSFDDIAESAFQGKNFRAASTEVTSPSTPANPR